MYYWCWQQNTCISTSLFSYNMGKFAVYRYSKRNAHNFTTGTRKYYSKKIEKIDYGFRKSIIWFERRIWFTAECLLSRLVLEWKLAVSFDRQLSQPESLKMFWLNVLIVISCNVPLFNHAISLADSRWAVTNRFCWAKKKFKNENIISIENNNLYFVFRLQWWCRNILLDWIDFK